MHNNDNISFWSLKVVPDDEKSYISIEGYNDDESSTYIYDNSVANHKQLKTDDFIVVVNKKQVIGFSRIQQVTKHQTEKIRRRCPECGTTNYEPRVTLKPTYRCNKGHEFDTPKSELVNIVRFEAHYQDSFFRPNENIEFAKVRPYYEKYNRNMSIQRIFPDFFHKYAPSLFSNKTSSYSSDLENTQSHLIEDDPTLIFLLTNQDTRKKVLQLNSIREGQEKFKSKLSNRYGLQCMISGCQIPEIIDAAHIKPYRGINDNNVTNGLLLRSDLHRLYDNLLIGIEPNSLVLFVNNKIKDQIYKKYHGRTLIISNKDKRPSKEALKIRWQQFLDDSSE